MTATRSLRPTSQLHADHPSRRLLAAYLLSLALHVLLLYGLTGSWQRAASIDRQPVYYVDLVHKPVLNPQAGRPEPRTAAPSASVPAPSMSVANVPEKAVVPGKASPATRAPVKSPDRQVADALQKLRDERALQEKFAALRQSQTVPMDIPIGLPDATGNEAGVSSLVYVQAFIQQNWALSPYLLADAAKMAKIEAWVILSYSKSGKLESFRFERESPDLQFNESVKRALIKSQQLPVNLPQRLEEVRVVFNLKALAEARR